MQEFNDLCAIIEACKGDIEKASSGNKSAGTRIRKAMQDVKNQAQALRKAIMSLREK